MLNKFLPTLLGLFLLGPFVPLASAVDEDDVITGYSARLSHKDHQASDGYKLDSPAAVIRQDRANYHKFHKRDDEDDTDDYFDSAEHREGLERALERGHTTRAAYQAIMNGTPLISVNVYRAKGGGIYVDVKIVEE